MTVRIYANPITLAAAVADEVAGWLTAPNGGFTIGLAGGSTPALAYETLRSRVVPWRRVTGWMTDERHVPTDDPRSNAGMARHALFDHVPATLREIPWDDDPPSAAAAYEAQLATFLTRSPSGPEPGLVLLGVGQDGHTASLFPGSTVLDERSRDFVAIDVPGTGWRLTATPGLLHRARRTLFIVSGRAKAEAVAAVLDGDRMLPAAMIAAESRDPVFLLDRAAAALIEA
jgi:6-phosphogluconolactonase